MYYISIMKQSWRATMSLQRMPFGAATDVMASRVRPGQH